MLAQEAGSKGRSIDGAGGARAETSADPRRLPDGSIDCEFSKTHARQLRAALLAAMASAARRGLVRALRAAAATIRQSVHGRPVISHARR